jgi:hypothetical protein
VVSRANASARRVALEASGHLERSECWNGLRAGDPVIVSEVGIRNAEWRFRAHVRNRRNGAESVEVVGGRPGERTIRSFGPDRIFTVTKRGRRSRSVNGTAGRPSLAEAPQLPLG